jgi:hypothetical protein
MRERENFLPEPAYFRIGINSLWILIHFKIRGNLFQQRQKITFVHFVGGMIAPVDNKIEIVIPCPVSEQADCKQEFLPFPGKGRGLQKFRKTPFHPECIVEFLLVQLETGNIVADAV